MRQRSEKVDRVWLARYRWQDTLAEIVLIVDTASDTERVSSGVRDGYRIGGSLLRRDAAREQEVRWVCWSRAVWNRVQVHAIGNHRVYAACSSVCFGAPRGDRGEPGLGGGALF